MQWARGRNTPRTGYQSIAGHTHTIHSHTHTYGQFRVSKRPTCMSLDCGRKPEQLEGNPRGHRKNIQTPHRKA
uniref:Uncharacterized protein n=1 Tax=Anguilla anguilla TaxID=7936 RepID=A0A0E9SUC6_ANGAN